TIAGLPLQVGLYTAFLPMVVYALLGTSRVLSVSTTTTIAILGAAALGEASSAHPAVSPLAATATLAILVGALLLAARLLRLGFPRPRESWREHRGQHSRRLSDPHAARPFRRVRHVARGCGHSADELHRDDRLRARVRRQG